MKLNKTELQIKDALLHKWAGLMGGSRSTILSMTANAVINGREIGDVELQAEKEARRIYQKVTKPKRKR